ncbi:MAG: putative toxin-antitoxin system toxin component, PIN family [Pyrinomonadaceae bacterium]
MAATPGKRGLYRSAMTRPHQIVLDTNVLVAGLRSRRGASYKLLTLLNDPRWQVNLSTPLVLEYEEVLKRPGLVAGLSARSVDVFLDGLCAIANRHDIFYLWRPLSPDPDDDLLLELAVSAKADFIITMKLARSKLRGIRRD